MFNINDKVIVKASGRSAVREPATIIDKFASAISDDVQYRVRFDRNGYVPMRLFDEAQLDAFEEKAEYSFSFDIPEDEETPMVVAIAKKTVDGVTTEIGRGFGHIIHEGDDGFLQAASYALKRIWNQHKYGSNSKMYHHS